MAMRTIPIPRFAWIVLIVVAILGAIWLTRSYWVPWGRTAGIFPAAAATEDESAHEAHAAGASAVIVLSEQAKKNIGLKTGPVTLGVYEQSVSIPAIVTAQPGRTRRAVAAPLTGFVLDVFAVPGQAVQAGDPLFVLELTNEDLIDAEADFLNTSLALDVARSVLKRLQSVTEGALAQRVVYEQENKVAKLEGQLLVQRERLRLHGLGEKQISSIAAKNQLLREFLITAPQPHVGTDPGHLSQSHPELVSATTAESRKEPTSHNGGEYDDNTDGGYIVHQLPIKKGQLVQEGETLIVLADYSRLYIGGDAFERDAPALIRAAEEGWQVSAVLEHEQKQVVEGLNLVYVANEIDPESRTLRFYVNLPNEIVHKAHRDNNRVFPVWRFKPGQRIELRVPVDRWENQIVLPVGAIATDGPERYVFVQNGANKFRRQPVHVLHRGPDKVVVASDGFIYLGESVVLNAAHQLQMALKNKAGGGIDPHAGHSH